MNTSGEVLKRLSMNTIAKMKAVGNAPSEILPKSSSDRNARTPRRGQSSPTKISPVKLMHVPYLDSKLTLLLKDSLGGNTRTIMITTVSSEKDNYHQNLQSLNYASRASRISNKAIPHKLGLTPTKPQLSAPNKAKSPSVLGSPNLSNKKNLRSPVLKSNRAMTPPVRVPPHKEVSHKVSPLKTIESFDFKSSTNSSDQSLYLKIDNIALIYSGDSMAPVCPYVKFTVGKSYVVTHRYIFHLMH